MSFSSYEQVLVIQNQLVSGVSSVDSGYHTQTEPLYIAGMGYVDNFISGPTEGQLQVTRYMLGPDFIKDIGDEEPVSGGIMLANGQSVGFTRGRLLNYTVSCNVGEIPQIQNTFKVYGNLGGGISPIKRWSPTQNYVKDDMVSVSITDAEDGFAADEIYKAKDEVGNVNKAERDANGDLVDPLDLSIDANKWWEKITSLECQELLEGEFGLSERSYIIPTQGSITVSFQGSDENAVQGFNYSRGIDLESLYALREKRFKGTPLTDYEAIDVQIRYPIKSGFDFTVSFDNYKLSDMRAFLDYANWTKGRIEQTVTVTIRDPQKLHIPVGKWAKIDDPDVQITQAAYDALDFEVQLSYENGIIMQYSIPRAKLLSEAISSRTEDETTLKVAFEGYERDLNTFDPYFKDANDGYSGQGQAISEGREAQNNSVGTRKS